MPIDRHTVLTHPDREIKGRGRQEKLLTKLSSLVARKHQVAMPEFEPSFFSDEELRQELGYVKKLLVTPVAKNG